MTKKPATSDSDRGQAVDPVDQAIGQRLRDAREARNLSQLHVSTRSKWADPTGKGISRTALIGYEAGTSRPGTRELRILCETLNVSPNRLIFGTDSPSQATQHSAMQGMTQPGGLAQAIELALVLALLKGHERDALVSLALSLAGRGIGDLRLGGLRMTARLIAPAIERELNLAATPDLEAAMVELSKGTGANFGNDVQLEEGEVVGGTWLYPDPDRESKS